MCAKSLTSVDSGWFMTRSTSMPSNEMLFSMGRMDRGVPCRMSYFPISNNLPQCPKHLTLACKLSSYHLQGLEIVLCRFNRCASLGHADIAMTLRAGPSEIRLTICIMICQVQTAVDTYGIGMACISANAELRKLTQMLLRFTMNYDAAGLTRCCILSASKHGVFMAHLTYLQLVI